MQVQKAMEDELSSIMLQEILNDTKRYINEH